MSPKQNFRIFSVGIHYGDNKEAIPYTAAESNDIMDFLANPVMYPPFVDYYVDKSAHHVQLKM